jgi:hypothetical protein
LSSVALGASDQLRFRCCDLDLVLDVGRERRWGRWIVLQGEGAADAGDGAAGSGNLDELKAGRDVTGGEDAGDGGGAAGIHDQVAVRVTFAQPSCSPNPVTGWWAIEKNPSADEAVTQTRSLSGRRGKLCLA